MDLRKQGKGVAIKVLFAAEEYLETSDSLKFMPFHFSTVARLFLSTWERAGNVYSRSVIHYNNLKVYLRSLCNGVSPYD